MSNQGRSLDDLPLAAYSTGVVADEPDEETVAEPSHLSQQEAIVLAMGAEPPPSTEPAPAAPRGGGPGLPRLSVPRPSLPRPSLPRLPRFGGRTRAAAVAESPFSVAAPALAMPVARYPTSTPAPAPASPAIPGRARGVDLGNLGARLRNPRTAVRDPRVLFGGMVAIGVVLLGISFLGGEPGRRGRARCQRQPGARGRRLPTTPGPASIQVTGDFEAAFDLTGTAAVGKPADGQLLATWDDGAGTSVTLTGRVGSVTRTTTSALTLAITVMRNGAPVTFTSEAGECTIGMAEKMFNVTGASSARRSGATAAGTRSSSRAPTRPSGPVAAPRTGYLPSDDGREQPGT